MTLIVPSASGRDQQQVIDQSGASPDYIAVYIASYDPINLDASFRRNPPWRTFGHVSITLEETVFWESFINFEFQVFDIPLSVGHNNIAALGFNSYGPNPDGFYAVPYVIKWDFREGVSASMYWFT